MTNSNSILSACKRHLAVVSFLMLASIGWSQLAHGDSQHDFLAFLSVEGFNNLSDSVPGVEDSYLRPTGDFLYTYNSDKFRFLGEYIWSSAESEMERFEGGWRLDDQTMLWLGRFHNTSKFWTTEYHHGQFMQTSISRPGLEEWEDESGPLPSHITGASLEHKFIRSDQSLLDFGFSVGLGPKFEDQELVPLDVLNPESGLDLAVNFRMAYRPDVLSVNQIGLLGGWTKIPVVSASNPNLANLRDIKQLTIGLFADWRWTDWRLLTSWVYFNNKMESVASSENDEFVLGYLQIEYQASENWTFFGREEIGFGEDNSPYLSLLPAYIAHRHMLGTRWDFANKQSLTMEIADVSTQGVNFTHYHFKEIRLQWSAVFP